MMITTKAKELNDGTLCRRRIEKNINKPNQSSFTVEREKEEKK